MVSGAMVGIQSTLIELYVFPSTAPLTLQFVDLERLYADNVNPLPLLAELSSSFLSMPAFYSNSSLVSRFEGSARNVVSPHSVFKRLAIVHGHQIPKEGFTALKFLRNDILVSASDDGAVKLWYVHNTSLRLIAYLMTDILHEARVSDISVSDGRFVSVVWGNKIASWHIMPTSIGQVLGQNPVLDVTKRTIIMSSVSTAFYLPSQRRVGKTVRKTSVKEDIERAFYIAATPLLVLMSPTSIYILNTQTGCRSVLFQFSYEHTQTSGYAIYWAAGSQSGKFVAVAWLADNLIFYSVFHSASIASDAANLEKEPWAFITPGGVKVVGGSVLGDRIVTIPFPASLSEWTIRNSPITPRHISISPNDQYMAITFENLTCVLVYDLTGLAFDKPCSAPAESNTQRQQLIDASSILHTEFVQDDTIQPIVLSYMFMSIATPCESDRIVWTTLTCAWSPDSAIVSTQLSLNGKKLSKNYLCFFDLRSRPHIIRDNPSSTSSVTGDDVQAAATLEKLHPCSRVIFAGSGSGIAVAPISLPNPVTLQVDDLNGKTRIVTCSYLWVASDAFSEDTESLMINDRTGPFVPSINPSDVLVSFFTETGTINVHNLRMPSCLTHNTENTFCDFAVCNGTLAVSNVSGQIMLIGACASPVSLARLASEHTSMPLEPQEQFLLFELPNLMVPRFVDSPHTDTQASHQPSISVDIPYGGEALFNCDTVANLYEALGVGITVILQITPRNSTPVKPRIIISETEETLGEALRLISEGDPVVILRLTGPPEAILQYILRVSLQTHLGLDNYPKDTFASGDFLDPSLLYGNIDVLSSIQRLCSTTDSCALVSASGKIYPYKEGLSDGIITKHLIGSATELSVLPPDILLHTFKKHQITFYEDFYLTVAQDNDTLRDLMVRTGYVKPSDALRNALLLCQTAGEFLVDKTTSEFLLLENVVKKVEARDTESIVLYSELEQRRVAAGYFDPHGNPGNYRASNGMDSSHGDVLNLTEVDVDPCGVESSRPHRQTADSQRMRRTPQRRPSVSAKSETSYSSYSDESVFSTYSAESITDDAADNTEESDSFSAIKTDEDSSSTASSYSGSFSDSPSDADAQKKSSVSRQPPPTKTTSRPPKSKPENLLAFETLERIVVRNTLYVHDCNKESISQLMRKGCSSNLYQAGDIVIVNPAIHAANMTLYQTILPNEKQNITDALQAMKAYTKPYFAIIHVVYTRFTKLSSLFRVPHGCIRQGHLAIQDVTLRPVCVHDLSSLVSSDANAMLKILGPLFDSSDAELFYGLPGRGPQVSTHSLQVVPLSRSLDIAYLQMETVTAFPITSSQGPAGPVPTLTGDSPLRKLENYRILHSYCGLFSLRHVLSSVRVWNRFITDKQNHNMTREVSLYGHRVGTRFSVFDESFYAKEGFSYLLLLQDFASKIIDNIGLDQNITTTDGRLKKLPSFYHTGADTISDSDPTVIDDCLPKQGLSACTLNLSSEQLSPARDVLTNPLYREITERGRVKMLTEPRVKTKGESVLSEFVTELAAMKQTIKAIGDSPESDELVFRFMDPDPTGSPPTETLPWASEYCPHLLTKSMILLQLVANGMYLPTMFSTKEIYEDCLSEIYSVSPGLSRRLTEKQLNVLYEQRFFNFLEKACRRLRSDNIHNMCINAIMEPDGCFDVRETSTTKCDSNVPTTVVASIHVKDLLPLVKAIADAYNKETDELERLPVDLLIGTFALDKDIFTYDEAAFGDDAFCWHELSPYPFVAEEFCSRNSDASLNCNIRLTSSSSAARQGSKRKHGKSAKPTEAKPAEYHLSTSATLDMGTLSLEHLFPANQEDSTLLLRTVLLLVFVRVLAEFCLKAKSNPGIFFSFLANPTDIKRYSRCIVQPMWINLIIKRILSGFYSSIGCFANDLRLISGNCEVYNSDEGIVQQCNEFIEGTLSRMFEILFALCKTGAEPAATVLNVILPILSSDDDSALDDAAKSSSDESVNNISVSSSALQEPTMKKTSDSSSETDLSSSYEQHSSFTEDSTSD